MDTRKQGTRRLSSAAIAVVATLLLGVAEQPAVAEFKTVVDYIEMSTSNIILPRTVNGMVSFRPCVGACEEKYRRARLTPETRFFVGDRAVKYSDFQASFSRVRSDDEGYALLSVDNESITITSIRIQG